VTDEDKEVEVDSGDKYGLAETPFSGYGGRQAFKSVEPEAEKAEEPSNEPAATEPAADEGEKPSEELAVEEPAAEPPVEPVVEGPVEPAAEEAASGPEEAAGMAPEVPTAEEVSSTEAAVEEPPQKRKEKEEPTSQMDYSDTFRTLSVGDVVDGVVVHIDKEGVLVDVGTKSEGIIQPHELSREVFASLEDVVQVGERIDVYVMRSGSDEEHLMLSKKRADFERAWGRVEEAHRQHKTITAMVTDRVKGGLVVDLGIRGFVPGSHVGSGKLKNLDKYVGQSIPLKVIEVDRDRRKVVLSHRLAVEQDRESQRAETLASLAEGEIREGIVRRLTDYGAFIDLGGVDGLLHISEMSWTRINHPSEVLRVGDHIQVMVLRLNLAQGRVSLGLRQILPDPWSEVARKYRVGEVIKCKVSRLVPFGAFVQVEGGVEGIIPNAELAVRRVSKPEEVVSVGQEVEAKVIDVRVEERRMTLSLRSLQQQRDREQLASYTSQTKGEQRTTVADLVGDIMDVATRRGLFEKERGEEPEDKEQELLKPKPKKRASKAERRAQEVDLADEEIEPQSPAPEQEPEARGAPEVEDKAKTKGRAKAKAKAKAKPKAGTPAEAAAEPAAEAGEAAMEAIASDEAPAEPAESAAEDKAAEE